MLYLMHFNRHIQHDKLARLQYSAVLSRARGLINVMTFDLFADVSNFTAAAQCMVKRSSVLFAVAVSLIWCCLFTHS